MGTDYFCNSGIIAKKIIRARYFDKWYLESWNVYPMYEEGIKTADPQKWQNL